MTTIGRSLEHHAWHLDSIYGACLDSRNRDIIVVNTIDLE